MNEKIEKITKEIQNELRRFIVRQVVTLFLLVLLLILCNTRNTVLFYELQNFAVGLFCVFAGISVIYSSISLWFNIKAIKQQEK